MYDVLISLMTFSCFCILGPASCAITENWIVFTYWNRKTMSNEASVVELYEQELELDS